MQKARFREFLTSYVKLSASRSPRTELKASGNGQNFLNFLESILKTTWKLTCGNNSIKYILSYLILLIVLFNIIEYSVHLVKKYFLVAES